MSHEFLFRAKAKERLEVTNGLSEQNFEERTKSFILRAQQRHEILERKRKRSEEKLNDGLVLDKEFRIKRQVEREESAFSETSTESSNPLETLIMKMRSQSGKAANDLRERWGDTWNRTVQVLKDGVAQVQESAKVVGGDLEKRWDTLKESASTLLNDRTNLPEFVTVKQLESEDSKKEGDKPSPKGGLVDRIRGLFSSKR